MGYSIVAMTPIIEHTKFLMSMCYAPINEVDEDVTDNFYKILHAVIKDIPKHDVMSVVGDLNTKVGSDCQYYPDILREHGLDDINKNGTLLLDYALSNDLVIVTTFSTAKQCIHTWTSPGGSTQNQVDHLLVSPKWHRSLLDIRES
ncbi:hypothetical protein QYM36_013544 [Artemia franciscana]|uniref:Endonuclease/exonuclease/phosphatase domain-containing protein n=1 Tax=Artemia franciscana TaxID=6661 RepID=A0AA88HLL6_ARTSF|nr:hypothetical protein QYM36_013544 [Artemia franciscana]